MGLFDSILGSVLGGGDKTQMAINLATSLIANHSSGQGLNGLVQQFENAGLGHIVQSWVGNGTNIPITGDQIQQVLGSQFVQQFAAQHGIPLAQAAPMIAQILPQLVNHVTPNGQVPPPAEVQNAVAGIASDAGATPQT